MLTFIRTIHDCLLVYSARKLILVFLAAVFAVTTVNPAYAVVVEGLFEVTMPVPDETDGVRRVALADGLAEVLIRISSDSTILQKITPPVASTYVKQFRYLSADQSGIATRSTRDRETPRVFLWVQYNATKVMDFLRNELVPIWGTHRSEVVVWLAVRDGSNQYLLKKSDSSVIKTEIEASFKRRGIPIVWPLNDKQDRQSLRFADIWGGFREPLLAASSRYSRGPVVSGSMSWNGVEWITDWSLFMDRDRRWALRGQQHESLIAEAINQLADEIGLKLAVMESMDEMDESQVFIDIDQVLSVDEFVRVQKYLTTLPLVQRVQLSRVDEGRALFNVTLRSEVEDFLKLIETGSEITQLADANPAPNTKTENRIYHFKLTN